MKTILTVGKIKCLVMVDDEDHRRLNRYKWYLVTSGIHRKSKYAIRSWFDKKEKRLKSVYLHREIMRAKKGEYIDHIDGNGLNNQRKNLRFCTLSENQWNRIGWKNHKTKGVYWHKKTGKWQVSITRNGKQKYVGIYGEKNKAIKIYKKVARLNDKEFFNYKFLEQLKV